MRLSKRLCTIVAQISRSHKYIVQSRDRATIVRNLRILRMRKAISKLRKFSDCAEHMYFDIDELVRTLFLAAKVLDVVLVLSNTLYLYLH